jgi:hypothetical protein
VLALLVAGVSSIPGESAPESRALGTVTSLANTNARVPVLTRADSDNVLANFRLVDRIRRVDLSDTAGRLLPHRRIDG